MKRIVWLGAAALIALVAAIPLWLVLDDGGERRAAALQEPTGSGDIGRLTLIGKNGGNPFPVRSFTFALSRGVSQPTGVESKRELAELRLGPLQVLRRIDNASPLLFEMGVTSTEASGKLELGAEKPYMMYSFTDLVVGEWSNDKAELVGLHHKAIGAELLGPAPTAPSSAVVGRMTVPALSKTPVPIIAFDTGFKRDVSRTRVQPDEVEGTWLLGRPEHQSVVVKRAFDTLAPQLLQSIQGSAPLGDITIELIAPGTTTPYVTYGYENAILESVEDSGAAGSLPTQSINFVFNQVEIKTQSNAALDDVLAPKT